MSRCSFLRGRKDAKLKTGTRAMPMFQLEIKMRAMSAEHCAPSLIVTPPAPLHGYMHSNVLDGLSHGTLERETPSAGVSDICYGMLHDLWAQFIQEVSAALPTRLDRATDSTHSSIGLDLTGSSQTQSSIALLRFACSVLGSLDTDAGAKLSSALHSYQHLLRFDVFLVRDDRASEIINHPLPSQVRVSINIYGPQGISAEVGRALSKAKFYLQQPDILDNSIVYDNPHYFKTSTEVLSPRTIVPVPTTPTREIWNIIDSLKNASSACCLQSIQPDYRICSPLLEHQLEGLASMQSLELPDGPRDKLWEPQNPYGEVVYRHAATGRKVKRPSDTTWGGILADTMGLGKSLTTISLIMGSLDSARNDTVPSKSEMNYQTPNSGKVQAPSTLIVASPSLLGSWDDEIKRHISKGAVSVMRYHGERRFIDLHELVKFDIILTTYATIAADYGKPHSPLGKIDFYRIVIDEAHYIRNCKNKQFIAISNLSARRRWCLTATPLQNSLDDLESLLKFIRISPFDDGTSFRDHIIAPLKLGRDEGLKNLRTLLKAILLRRSIEVFAKVPGVQEVQRVLRFSENECQCYDQVTATCKEDIEELVCTGNARIAHQAIVQTINRLRILCNHGVLEATNPTDQAPSEPRRLLPPPLCVTPAESLSPSPSLDDFSLQAETAGLELSPGPSDASQNEDLMDLDPHYLGEPLCEPGDISTKITVVANDIDSHKIKSIVFSFWVKTLDFVGASLRRRGVKYVRLDGSMNAVARTNALNSFKDDLGVRTLLMTTGTGAVGLNLTVAKHIHLVEPQWNPMIEIQAIGRAHRYGQDSEVIVFRYIMEDSIEKQVQARSLLKLQLAEITLDEKGRDGETKVKERIKQLQAIL